MTAHSESISKADLYTGETLQGPNQEVTMFPSRITPQTILRILIGGFSLVTLLLFTVVFVSYRTTYSIQRSTARLANEQLLTTRLINKIQIEQSTLNAVFFQLTRRPESFDRTKLMQQLDATDRDLLTTVEAASETQDEVLWRELGSAARTFSREARRMVNTTESSAESFGELFRLHDRVFFLVNQLVATATERSTTLDAEIGAETQALHGNSLVLLGTCIVLAILCAFLTVRMTTQSFQQVEWQAGELTRVSWHMLQSQEATARRFSHELHDELGQSLAAVKANLSGLEPSMTRADCLHLVEDAIANVRELSQLLRPVILDDFGLDASLRWLTERFAMRTNIVVHYESEFDARFADDTETHLFRIGQEALTNIARHSGATEVWMTLRATGDRVSLRIRDNGCGLLPAVHKPSLGMVGMRARAAQAGGELKVESPAGGGVCIDVWTPLTPADDESAGNRRNDPVHQV
jgi:signal transduction histidine kinase